MLCILLLTGSGTAFSVNYPKVFGDDWTSAVQYVHEQHAAWKPLFEAFGVDARLAEAVVFPELIRYSRWQDEIETAAVNGLYVLQGTSGANFSIGRFYQVEKKSEKGGLTSTIVPDETQNGPIGNNKFWNIYGSLLSVVLCQICRFNHVD